MTAFRQTCVFLFLSKKSKMLLSDALYYGIYMYHFYFINLNLFDFHD
ncbi:hypothetical protein MsAm2_06110 [Methanolapillus ohkumae]|uniref:Uncharacterized protein n=1 Tax=Methanolapillus ohkumae TaxID=3028298 RepID=A0AA96V6H2_9EURY|nr:hypothetical protein MsAm2_06110 [Methanosarcinaceae archaeon Am2]